MKFNHLIPGSMYRITKSDNQFIGIFLQSYGDIIVFKILPDMHIRMFDIDLFVIGIEPTTSSS
jgi:hypothetical protein